MVDAINLRVEFIERGHSVNLHHFVIFFVIVKIIYSVLTLYIENIITYSVGTALMTELFTLCLFSFSD